MTSGRVFVLGSLLVLATAGCSTGAKGPQASVSSVDAFPDAGRIVLNTLDAPGPLQPHSSARIRVTNDGTGSLRVSAAVAVTRTAGASAPPGSFSLSGLPARPLGTHASAELVVTYRALAHSHVTYQPDYASLTVTTNAANRPRTVITLVGLRESAAGTDEPTLATLDTAFGWPSTRDVTPTTGFGLRPIDGRSFGIREYAAFGPVDSSLVLQTEGRASRTVLARAASSSTSAYPLSPSGRPAVGTVAASGPVGLREVITVPGTPQRISATTDSPPARWKLLAVVGSPHTYLLGLDEPTTGMPYPPNRDYQDEVFLVIGAEPVAMSAG